MIVTHVHPVGWVDTGEAGLIQPSEVSGLVHVVTLEAGDLLQGPQGVKGDTGLTGPQGVKGDTLGDADGNVNLSGTSVFSGIGLKNSVGSVTVDSYSFVDTRNELNVATASMIVHHDKSGGADIVFSVTPSGARSVDRRKAALSISRDGVVLAVSGGIGYGGGVGGSVTQATSKSTAVVINKLSGQITMNGEILLAGGCVSFLVFCSAFGAADVVVVNLAGGVGSFQDYRVAGCVQGAGSFVVSLENRLGIALSDAVKVNFSIIKGSFA